MLKCTLAHTKYYRLHILRARHSYCDKKHNLWWRWCRSLRCNHRMLCHCMVQMSLWRCTSWRLHHSNTRSDLLYCVRCVLWRCRCLVARRCWLLWRLLLLLLWTRLTVTRHWRRNTTMWGNVNHLRHCTFKTQNIMLTPLLNTVEIPEMPKPLLIISITALFLGTGILL